MPKCLVFMYKGCEPVECYGTVDTLRRCGVEVTIYAHEQIVELGHGLKGVADTTEHQSVEHYDCLVLPGGMGWKNLQADAYAKELTSKFFAAKKIVAAICAAPSVALGHWGMIDGRHATCYPGMESMGMQKAKHSHERIVEDGNLITAQGPGVSLEFGIAIAKKLGQETDGVRKGMLIK